MDKLRLLQELSGLKRIQLAALLGVSRTAYYKWLRGGSLTREHQAKVQDMLDVYLIKGWLKHARSLPWGYTHRTYEDMKDDLDSLG